jgi:metal-responsive CopG/Arc/MetJ family transcriptional regulator
MKTAVSIPDELFDSAETLGKRLGVSRSRLYATALEDFVAKHQAKKVTERLNAVYASHDGRVDRVARRLQARSLTQNQW